MTQTGVKSNGVFENGGTARPPLQFLMANITAKDGVKSLVNLED